MSDARWFEIDADLAAAKTCYENSLALAQAGGFEDPGLEGFKSNMALMHAMQAAYTSMESAFERVLSLFEEPLPVGRDWHKSLIDRVAAPLNGRPPVISPPLASALHESRKFRHIVVRNYTNFQFEECGPALRATRIILDLVDEDFKKFRDLVDPDPDLKPDRRPGPR